QSVRSVVEDRHSFNSVWTPSRSALANLAHECGFLTRGLGSSFFVYTRARSTPAVLPRRGRTEAENAQVATEFEHLIRNAYHSDTSVGVAWRPPDNSTSMLTDLDVATSRPSNEA